MVPKLIFLGLFAVLVVGYWLFRKHVPFALLLLIASLFFSRLYWEVFGNTVRLEQLASLFLFAVFVFDIIRKKIQFRLDWRTGLIAGVFLMMILSSLLASPFPSVSLRKTLVYFPYILAFIALSHYLFETDLWLKSWHFLYGAGAVTLAFSMVSFYLFLFGVNLGTVRMEWGSLWLRGTMVIPNVLGSTAVIIFLIAFMRSIWKQGQTKSNFLDLAVLIIATSCILTSFSRAAWIGAVLGIFITIALAFKKASLKKLALSFAIIVATVGLTYLATTNIEPHLGDVSAGKSLGEFGEKQMDKYWVKKETKKVEYADKFKKPFKKGAFKAKSGEFLLEDQHVLSIRHRWDILTIALNDWRLSPFIGRGTDTLILVNANRPEFYISSSWLTILHDWGILAFAMSAVFMLIALVALWKSSRRSSNAVDQMILVTLIVILVVSIMMDQVATTIQLSIYWVLLAFYALAPLALSGVKKTVSLQKP